MRDCIKRLIQASNDALSRKEAKEILDTIDRAAKRKSNDGFDYDEAVSKEVKDRIENMKENVAKQKANLAKNVIMKAQNADKISAFIDAGLDVKTAFAAELEGVASHIEGTRASLDVQKSAVEHAYFSRMLKELSESNLLELFNSKTLSDEIGKELWALSEKTTVTTNKQAKQIADIIYKTREGQRQRLNAAGADISEVGGYIMPQRHDVFEMHRVGKEAWISRIKPLLNKERSFGGDYESLDKALSGAYDAMLTGIRMGDPLERNAKLFQFSGPDNLGKKLSQARQLHFKDYASWKQWNDAFGLRDLNEGIVDSIRSDSHNIALMERYGTNPEAMLKAVATQIKEKYRGKMAKQREEGVDKKLQSFIDAALEKNNIPASPTLARLGSNIRVYQNVTKLGGALRSSLTDIPLKALEYKFQGRSWLGATVQPWLDIGHGFKSKSERVKWASLTGVGFESMIADIGGRFSAQDTLSNKAAKVQRLFFKLNGLSWWTDSHQGAMSRVMAHHLGLEKNTPFAKLDTDTRRLFGNYRISEADWNAMRAAVKTLDDGRDYILPDSLEGALKEKLTGYYIDRAKAGVITPTTKEQRITNFGTQRGTAIGEATRLIMQFKSFNITQATKVWGRAIYGKGHADIPAMIYLMLNTMAFGYAVGALKDLMMGRTPKDPNKLETVYAALAQGGGMGILGDILLNDESGFGRSATQTLAGPTFGTIDDVFKIYSAGIRGGGSKRQATMTAINAIPFNNLFYARAALDHMILLQMQEELNPGYLRRMKQNMRKTYGQEMIYQ